MASSVPSQPVTLSGKVAIVTGGSRGIGAAVALELAKRGAKVSITFVSPSGTLADQVVSTINNLGNGASAIKMKADMRSMDSPGHIISETTTAFGESIDILVNNAGMEFFKPLGSISVEEYTEVCDLNVRSVVFMTQAVLPYLRAPGRIISIGSVMGRLGRPDASIYSATKVALEALSRGWASELGPASHTVNVVAPAFTRTDMLTRVTASAESEQVVQMHEMMTPVEHRLGEAVDIALVVAMLAEPSSRWITGQTLQAGGGIYMS
ncbi:short-chain dehydrogenase/reductase SDR [Aspergillus terreus]|uniref:Short-chain dehydrogenase/reductase SDR n=1 Tax=Aspergillus terreus TaxID=33178 RepID=A0A5M3ZB34_ASPTE|nr:hypothetical protein ATETN484_0013023100 [Aspergillus terreus]GFF20465.1 short-chain dehydrogenase/reductase SDR [Aspergillus terreus]